MSDRESAQRFYEKAHHVARIWARARSGDFYMGIQNIEMDWRQSLIYFHESPSGGGVFMGRIRWSIPMSFLDELESVIMTDAKTRREVETAAAIAKQERIDRLRNSDVVHELQQLGYRLEAVPSFWL